MNTLVDRWLEPGLWLLGDWSLRWAVLIAALGLCFAVRPPRQAGLRLAACQLVLIAGLALPLIPHWWGPLPPPARSPATTDSRPLERPAINFIDRRPLAAPKTPPGPASSQPGANFAPNRSESPASAPPSGVAVPTAEPFGTRRALLLVLGLAWAIGMAVQLIRLAVAARVLSRLACQALPPIAAAEALFDRCRAESGLRRPVRLGLHPTLAAPVFLGGRRALILVPANWDQLAAEAQQAILWHELAHVARRDDLAKVAEETVRAVFFFHPLVAWLINRIDVYREQVCDAAAIRHGVAGRTLAHILVDFSRRNGASAHAQAALHPALPFFRRRTVRNRIRELVNGATLAQWSAPLVRRQFVGLSAVAVATGFALGGFGIYAADLPPGQAPSSNAGLQTPPPASSAKAEETAPAATKEVTTSKTLARILANWKARQKRMRSLYFSWEGRLKFGEKGQWISEWSVSKQKADPRSRRFHYWADGPDRVRLDSAPLLAPVSGDSFAFKTHFVINGSTECRVDVPVNGTGAPIATLGARRGENLLSSAIGTRNGLALALYPPDAFVLNPRSGQFRVIAEDALSFGDVAHCVKIQNSNENGTVYEKCLVDPARDDIIISYELQLDGYRQISIRYERDPVHGWIPVGWTFREPGVLCENKVNKRAVNEPFPDDTFSLEASPGTIVFDLRTVERYRAGKDGARVDVVHFDTIKSLETAEILESTSDFRVERQSLKDAIDFIAARYQLPILVQKANWEAVGVNPEVEVGPLPAGITIADLLRQILAKSPKPAGFRIENEVLTISPKFAGRQPIGVQPAVAPPKLATPKAQKIQDALETPVDFNIEPQSLKDALDFIAARYQIRIHSDPLMDSLVGVKGAFPGIKLKNLLTILLEQCPGQPLGFKIERDALEIGPVTKP